MRQAARERVVKLQQALEVLGEIAGPEVDGLRSALEKAKNHHQSPRWRSRSQSARASSLGPRCVWPPWMSSEAKRRLLWRKDESGCKNHWRDDAASIRWTNARRGLRGVRVGEASHPDPARRRRRVTSLSSGGDGQGFLSSDDQREVDVPSTVCDPTTQVSQIRGTQAEVVSDDEPLIRPSNGRHVVPRMEHGSADVRDLVVHEQPAGCATVPASAGALRAAGRDTSEQIRGVE